MNVQKGEVGYHEFYMALIDILDQPMNHKKILRLMRKFNLYAKIRRKNLEKAIEDYHSIPNQLKCEFKQDEAGKVFLTDITLLTVSWGETAYLSYVKDIATRDIVAYVLSSTLKRSIVYQTLEQLNNHLDGNLHTEAMIHSDQGFHYTHPEFQHRVKELGLKQSMSRRGNCLDNALNGILLWSYEGRN